ncbi:sulfur carrier protein ThiS [Cloacibacillus sp. An23]|uniref:sulfur carrier protein ThiS n=1 Tax=Cloacibacillus sp. An23 TaxID=1965591 RepID=UPI000B377C40|nr:sulfur carrier protein ThiS [Cloacibacillus sp. An23]OUO94962.1 thiamine biosynthesis protein ThiS [Cloacibacillus sp. An23]
MITVNGDKFPWREGLTVSDVLKEKNFKFKMLSVWVNDNVIDKGRYAEAKIPDGADVQVIHNISGG